tara:strand:+ start:299 stop:514 length:216 start_codon:yes stop_codon:yes gene_type:complete
MSKNKAKEYRDTVRYKTEEFEILEEARKAFGTKGFSKTIKAVLYDWKNKQYTATLSEFESALLTIVKQSRD